MPTSNTHNGDIRVHKPRGKPVEFKSGTTRARVASLMDGRLTFPQIAKRAGITVEQAKAHAACNLRDKNVGYAVDALGKVKAIVRGAVAVKDLVH